jgi:hypothetical protein
MLSRKQEQGIDIKQDVFPYCLVWTPIPCLTWIVPFVGHMGICDSKGKIYDFAGPYYIGEGELAFGRTTRYIQIHADVSAEAWDQAVSRANACYAQKMHNLFCQNCHSHCATVLDDVAYKGFRNWNMLILAPWMFFCGRFVSISAFLWSILPALILWSVFGYLFSRI